MLQALATARNRNRTLLLLAACGILAAVAAAVGIDDNPLGVSLAFLSATAPGARLRSSLENLEAVPAPRARILPSLRSVCSPQQYLRGRRFEDERGECFRIAPR